MLRLTGFAVMALAFFPTIGCSHEKIPDAAREALEQANELVLYSLHPGYEEAEAAKEDEKFHGWKRLGQTSLDGEEAIEPLFTAFKKGVNENDGRVAGCFNPRHGIMVMHGENKLEFVICFECFQVQWFVNGEKQKGFLITDSPQPTFDKILKDAEVPLPPQKK